jgi:hypothetical protein
MNAEGGRSAGGGGGTRMQTQQRHKKERRQKSKQKQKQKQMQKKETKKRRRRLARGQGQPRPSAGFRGGRGGGGGGTPRAAPGRKGNGPAKAGGGREGRREGHVARLVRDPAVASLGVHCLRGCAGKRYRRGEMGVSGIRRKGAQKQGKRRRTRQQLPKYLLGGEAASCWARTACCTARRTAARSARCSAHLRPSPRYSCCLCLFAYYRDCKPFAVSVWQAT